jgi:hypothetical protein
MLGEGYIDDGLLAFEADLQLRLREHDVQVAALDVGGDGDGDVDVGDRLGPFVGERRLLGVFFRFGGRVFGGALFWRGRRGHAGLVGVVDS